MEKCDLVMMDWKVSDPEKHKHYTGVGQTRIDILPYQRAAGAKYGMVGKKHAPDFDESVAPKYFLEQFDARGIPYQVFK